MFIRPEKVALSEDAVAQVPGPCGDSPEQAGLETRNPVVDRILDVGVRRFRIEDTPVRRLDLGAEPDFRAPRIYDQL